MIKKPLSKHFLLVLLATTCIFIVAVGALFFSLQTRLSSSAIQSVDYEIFTSKLGGFSINYPTSWNAIETPQGSTGDDDVIAVLIPPGRSFPQLYIAQHSFTDGNIDVVVDWGEKRIANRAIYTNISISNMITPNIEGVSKEYMWKDQTWFGEYSIRCKDLYLIREHTGFGLSFCADEKQWKSIEPVFEEMINSFMFISAN